MTTQHEKERTSFVSKFIKPNNLGQEALEPVLSTSATDLRKAGTAPLDRAADTEPRDIAEGARANLGHPSTLLPASENCEPSYRSLEAILTDAYDAAERRGDTAFIRLYANFLMEASVDL